jgi:RNA polymerase sigma-70 factor (ECF subfamily)
MDDVRAVQECLRGVPEAFRHLVERYQGRAFAHARVLTRNHADAADATQEAFVDAFRSLRTFDLTREFYPWFYTLLRNRCFKQRTRRATRAESAPFVDRPAPAGVSEGEVDIWRAIHRLDPSDAELILLKHLEGWTYEELSAQLGIPKGTVMSRLFAARQKLQALIDGVRS